MGKKLLISVILIAFLAGSLVTGSIAFGDDDLTKLQKKCAKEPKDPQKVKPVCELLAMINAIPAGPQGEQGPQGDPGPSNYYTVKTASVVTNNAVTFCDNGDIAVGGGAAALSPNTLVSSFPVSNFNCDIDFLNTEPDVGWCAFGTGEGVIVFATCLDLGDLHIP